MVFLKGKLKRLNDETEDDYSVESQMKSMDQSKKHSVKISDSRQELVEKVNSYKYSKTMMKAFEDDDNLNKQPEFALNGTPSGKSKTLKARKKIYEEKMKS